MVALQVDVLPQSSVALQIRVFTTGQVPLALVLTITTSTVASQASLAVALPHTGTAGLLIVVLAGQFFVVVRRSLRSILARQVAVSAVYNGALQIRVFTTGQVPD